MMSAIAAGHDVLNPKVNLMVSKGSLLICLLLSKAADPFGSIAGNMKLLKDRAR